MVWYVCYVHCSVSRSTRARLQMKTAVLRRFSRLSSVLSVSSFHTDVIRSVPPVSFSYSVPPELSIIILNSVAMGNSFWWLSTKLLVDILCFYGAPLPSNMLNLPVNPPDLNVKTLTAYTVSGPSLAGRWWVAIDLPRGLFSRSLRTDRPTDVYSIFSRQLLTTSQYI